MLPAAMPELPVRLDDGRALPMTVRDYDAARPAVAARHLRAVCYAPFLSMDFDASGAIRLCNHSHRAVGHVGRGQSVLEIWRGAVYQHYRRTFAEYVFDADNCRHCVRQCEAGTAQHVFATEQFDRWATDDATPAYPKRLIFRLNSTCNLACVMCDGVTSSRIRKERDGLPPTRSAYDEAFFTEMAEILPHVEHLEFYGGEPFLVAEHQRIFDLLQRLGARCTIYANTNTTAFHPAARRALETLNFVEIAVSMDAANAAVHGAVRRGLQHDAFLRNVDYLLQLRERRGVRIGLNVTEHRKNWFDLPEVFRFAEPRRLPIHVNTCLHPHNVTLYTLPDEQLRYVLDHLVTWRERLRAEFPDFANLASYDFLLSLLRTELAGRGPSWRPQYTNTNRHCDGLLAAPIAGTAPFAEPLAIVQEARRMVQSLAPEVAARLVEDFLAPITDWSPYEAWWATVPERPVPTLAELRPWCRARGLPLLAGLYLPLQDLGDLGFQPFRERLC